jgi:endonuclease/exonuclease/phosphatase (EEP) superfamily protein YafD
VHVAAALVVGGCVRIPASASLLVAGEGVPAGVPDTFDVLSFNAHKNRHALDTELSRLADGADVVLLQEAVGVQTAPGQRRAMVVAFRRRRDERPAGVLTATTTAVLREIPLLSAAREPWVRTPKSALVSLVRLDRGDTLMVVNVHGINFRPAAALRDQLAALRPWLAAHDGPAIVGGDFNTWSRARHATLDAFCRELGLRPSFSGPAAPRLDAILYRGLKLQRAEILPAAHSDHDALRVRFRVPTPAPA